MGPETPPGGLHIDEQPIEYTQLPIDVDSTLDCFRTGLVLTEEGGVPVGILVFRSSPGSSVSPSTWGASAASTRCAA